MLIEFSVENYKSIKGRQTLSLVAQNRDKRLIENTIAIDLPGLKNTHLLRSVVIYGANASGKSNIFKAAKFLHDFIENSATKLKPNEETGISVFRLDPYYESQPSTFEIHFIHDNVRYEYGISLSKKRVEEEWLFAFPFGSSQRWFSRIFDETSGNYDWKFSSYLKGQKESLVDKTRENASFISSAAQFNHEQLTKVYEWFIFFFRFIDFSEFTFPPEYTIDLLKQFQDDEFTSGLVRELLYGVDLGLSGFRVIDNDQNGNRATVNLLHKSIQANKEIEFESEDESAGTLKYLSLIGPWIETCLNGYTLFIDEIGAKMHPILVKKLIRIMKPLSMNDKHPQGIFTTHDTSLLDQELLRRDQIWFTEKNEEGATNLYPLIDYKPRNDEALYKGYLAGRYGGIPVF